MHSWLLTLWRTLGHGSSSPSQESEEKLCKASQVQTCRVCGWVVSGRQKRQDSPHGLTSPGLVPGTTRDAKIRSKPEPPENSAKSNHKPGRDSRKPPCSRQAGEHSQPWVSKSQRPCHLSFQANGPSRTCDSQLSSASAWVSEGDPRAGPCVGTSPFPSLSVARGIWRVECQALGLDPEFRSPASQLPPGLVGLDPFSGDPVMLGPRV